jgi:hypothetical protein
VLITTTKINCINLEIDTSKGRNSILSLGHCGEILEKGATPYPCHCLIISISTVMHRLAAPVRANLVVDTRRDSAKVLDTRVAEGDGRSIAVEVPIISCG